jgi:SAM-dependent methyltransferase
MNTLSTPEIESASRTAERSSSNPVPKSSRPLEPGDWDQRYSAQEFIWTVEPNRFLVTETENLQPGKALDLAAGEGRNAIWLAEQGWHTCAVDFSEVAIEKGRRLAAARQVSQKVNFQVADLRHYEMEDGSFDLVALIYLQIPQETLIPILKRAAKAVAPGGTFLLVAHDSSNLAHGYGGPKHADMLYTADQVLHALDGELDIEKSGTVERPIQTDDGTKVAIDCLVRAKRRSR